MQLTCLSSFRFETDHNETKKQNNQLAFDKIKHSLIYTNSLSPEFNGSSKN